MTTSALAGPGRHSVYTGRTTNWPMVVLSVALVAPLLALSNMSAGDRGDLVILLLVIGVGVLLEVLTSSSVRTLRLTLHSGRTVTITVPDAPTAVAVFREAASH